MLNYFFLKECKWRVLGAGGSLNKETCVLSDTASSLHQMSVIFRQMKMLRFLTRQDKIKNSHPQLLFKWADVQHMFLLLVMTALSI